MPAFNPLSFVIRTQRFQGLPVEIQDFLLSDKKSEQLQEIAKSQGLEGNNWIGLNDLVWGVFLREIDVQMFEQGISEYMNMDSEKAKATGEAIRKTIFVNFSEFFAPKKQNPNSVPPGNVVNLRPTNDKRPTTNDNV